MGEIKVKEGYLNFSPRGVVRLKHRHNLYIVSVHRLAVSVRLTSVNRDLWSSHRVGGGEAEPGAEAPFPERRSEQGELPCKQERTSVQTFWRASWQKGEKS